MSEHRLTDEGITKTLRIARTLVVFVIVEALAFWFALSKSGSINFALAILLLMSLVLAASLYTGRKRARVQLTSYVVTLDADRIRWDVQGTPTIEVARSDVTAIEERRPGGLAVYGRDRRKFVGVSDDIADYAAIRERLASWRAFDEKPPAKWVAVIATVVLTVVAFAITILSHNRIIVALVGSALAIALVICAVKIWRSPHFDRKMKRLSLVVALPIAVIIIHVVIAISGADFSK
jgi:heme/copper-type cytochrome/quinol oxidase subunit 4